VNLVKIIFKSPGIVKIVIKFETMTWFIDFEGYHFEYLDFMVKEIAILSKDGSQCFNYMIKYPCSMIYNPKDVPTAQFQFKRHGLSWECGDYTFIEAINDIKNKVGSDTVYVKGLEKSEYLKLLLSPNVKCVPEHPPFRDLENCLEKQCGVHGKHCARRKVFEICYWFEKIHKQAKTV
jgi:hypothetical protein